MSGGPRARDSQAGQQLTLRDPQPVVVVTVTVTVTVVVAVAARRQVRAASSEFGRRKI